MSYIWIDLGNKRCWLAVEVEGIVLPKAVVPRVDVVKEIKKLISEYKTTTIVVWLPYDLYNRDTKQLEKTRKFVNKLKNIFQGQKVDTIDERFTSFEADNIMSETWESGHKDDLSAVLILESYLNNKK